MMDTKNTRIANVFAAATLLLYALGTLLNLTVYLLTGRTIFFLPTGLLLCIAVIVPCVMLMLQGIQKARAKQGKADLVLSILSLAISSVWSLACLISWETSTVRNVIVETCDLNTVSPSLKELAYATTDILRAYQLFTTFTALFLFVIAIISVLRAKQKLPQLKAELHKFAGGSIILIANVVSFTKVVLDEVMLNQSAQAYQTYSSLATYATFVIQVLATLIVIALLLTVGLINKKKAVVCFAQARADILKSD